MAIPIVDVVKTAAIAYVVYNVLLTVYNVWFHPLSKFPGPKVWIAFPFMRQLAHIRGVLDAEMCELHKEHGMAVRFGPGEVSFISEEAWRDIYDHKPNQLQRFILPVAKRPDIFDSDEVDHDRMRKAMSHSFSPKGLREQEPIVKGYIDLMVQRLREKASEGQAVDMVMWYTLTLFDVIGDLAFGQSFDGLRNSAMHFTISFTFEAFKLLTFIEAGAAYPLLFKLLELFTPNDLIAARDRKEAHAEETVHKRMNDKSLHGRGDFMDSMLRGRGTPTGLSDPELVANASTLITAGSETTSTILSGLTFWLLKSPEAYKKCLEEVRSAYSTEDEILMSNTGTRLPYMNACFLEAFRLYPPVPSGLQRVTPAGQTTKVAGFDIPANTKVSVHPQAAYTSPVHWARPTEYLPERWLPEAKTDSSSPFFKDARGVCQPFSVGPRSCPGRNMAEQEYRMVMARILYNFDLELSPESETWTDQKSHYLWEKHPLMIKLHDRFPVSA